MGNGQVLPNTASITVRAVEYKQSHHLVLALSELGNLIITSGSTHYPWLFLQPGFSWIPDTNVTLIQILLQVISTALEH